MNIKPLLGIKNLANYSVKDIAGEIKTQLLEIGEFDLVETLAKLKSLSLVADEVLSDDNVKEALYKKVSSYGNGKTKVLNLQVETAATSTSYDYSVCKHHELDNINKCIEQLEKRKKEIQETLKTVPINGMDIFVESVPQINWVSDGSLTKIYPPNKTQKLGVKFYK